MIVPPPKNDNEGAETYLLHAECRTPSFSDYTLADATTCMQLMDIVLWNRFNDPDKWRKGAKSIADIIRVKGQFAGFEKYPIIGAGIQSNIQAIFDIANNAKDKRSPAFTDHINAAIKIATDPTIVDPSPGTLAFWRAARSGSPAKDAKLHTTVLGNSFFICPLKGGDGGRVLVQARLKRSSPGAVPANSTSGFFSISLVYSIHR